MKMFKVLTYSSLLCSMAAAMPLLADNQCGDQITTASGGNPNLCCDNSGTWNGRKYTGNGSKIDSVDGNCVWFAWEQANRNWNGHRLPMINNANTWAEDRFKAINKKSGYIYSNNPRVDSSAIKKTGTYGHVAYVENVLANNVEVSEQNCYIPNEQNPNGGAEYSHNSFQKYMIGMTVENFEVVKNVTASETSTSKRPNFLARFKLKNISEQDIRIRAVKMHIRANQSNGDVLNDSMGKVLNGAIQSGSANYSYTDLGLIDGYLLAGEETDRIFGTYSFKNPRTDDTEAYIELVMWDNEVIEIGYHDFTVQ